jgi:ribosomal protein L23
MAALRRLLQSPALLREYILKPKGLTAPVPKLAPPKAERIQLLDEPFILQRSKAGKLNNKTASFWVSPGLSKPEIKQYLEKLYGVQVKKVQTVIFPGKTKLAMNRSRRVMPSRKKAFVEVTENVPEFLRER